jgi:hypothetical protein
MICNKNYYYAYFHKTQNLYNIRASCSIYAVSRTQNERNQIKRAVENQSIRNMNLLTNALKTKYGTYTERVGNDLDPVVRNEYENATAHALSSLGEKETIRKRIWKAENMTITLGLKKTNVGGTIWPSTGSIYLEYKHNKSSQATPEVRGI